MSLSVETEETGPKALASCSDNFPSKVALIVLFSKFIEPVIYKLILSPADLISLIVATPPFSVTLPVIVLNSEEL